MIEVGMYYRSIDGIIGKIKENGKTHNELIQALYDIGNIKVSNNIIDLIEVGDYVNRSKVIDINEKGKFIIIDYGMEGTIFSKNIKSILTKEQMKSMEYKVS